MSSPAASNSSSSASSSSASSSVSPASSASSTVSNISQQASAAAQKIGASASEAMQNVKSSLDSFDKQHHISSQLSDMASSASNAIKHGHPLEAVANAPAAARIGEAERMKHEAGPLAEDAHIANQAEPKEESATGGSAGTGGKMADATSHMKAAISHGHPVHAVKNASTAAMIGETEREKHDRGPISEDASGPSALGTASS